MSIYNEDELKAPEWINQEFLETVLREHEKQEDIKILDFKLSPACVKGDHYASVMFRCQLTYNVSHSGITKQKSLIIKTLPMEEGMKREMLMTAKLFETEIEMYTKTLPKIESILAEYGEATKLSAEIFYHSLKPHKVLVMEDLCESGYDTVRCRYLTAEEVKAVYRKLAKLHAVTFMLGHSEQSEIVTRHQDGLFSSSSQIMPEEIINNGIKKFMETLANNEEFHIYNDKLKKLAPELLEKCKQLYKAYDLNREGLEDIFVLNHGDFHMKNLMFKFNVDKQIEDLIMVDYQISCYAPSNIDLTYSEYMLLSPELRQSRKEFMQYYFEEFLRVLKKIDYSGELPKYSQFQISSLKYRHFAVFLFANFLPMVINFMISSASDLKDYDAAKLMENPELMMSLIYENSGLVDEIRSFMPVLLREGYLD